MNMKPEDHSYIKSVEIVEMIKVEWVHGLGTKESPIHSVVSYYKKDKNQFEDSHIKTYDECCKK